ncbi:MAG: DUF3883 domain-containing protein [Acidimicrobiales bacterium]|nr:DUF3883 domain-containing protein [Acidimicrobiales bacterium]
MVDSRATRQLSEDDRRLQLSYPIRLDPGMDGEAMARDVKRAQASIARTSPNAKGGNPTRRILLMLELENGAEPLELIGHLKTGSGTPATLTFDTWLMRIGATRKAQLDGSEAPHQATTIRWLAEHTPDRPDEYQTWQELRGPLADALAAAGVSNPQYPLVALARSGVLEHSGFPQVLPTASGNVAGLLNELNPGFRLPTAIAADLADDPRSRERLDAFLTSGADRPAVGAPSSPATWSATEDQATVEAYLSMLVAELADAPLSRSEVLAGLARNLTEKPKSAIERRFANISAVLDERGLPSMARYRPTLTYEQALADVADQQLADDRELLDALVPPPPSRVPVPPARVPPPPPTERKKRRGRHIDYERDQREKSAIGRLGEELAFEAERQRLIDAGHPQLAKRVSWAAKDHGDGLGYDIQSVREDGSVLYIEVKTTSGHRDTDFFISSAELEFAHEHEGDYELHRYFDVRRRPRFFILQNLAATVEVEPTVFRGRVRGDRIPGDGS